MKSNKNAYKLAICGKGGSGKSTIAALLAKTLVENGNSVLVIDTDESNFGLHRQLGVNLPPDFMEYFGGKGAVLEKIMQAAPDWDSVSFFEEELSFADIPAAYLSKNGEAKLLAIGKIHEVGEGCACSMGMLVKEFIEKLRLNNGEVVIVDTEAGIEHFGRGIEKSVDAVLMVIDPSYESLKLSEKIADLSSSIRKPIFFILNKVDESNEQFMRETVGNRHTVIAAVPADPSLLLAGLRGEEIMAGHTEIQHILQTLAEKCGYEEHKNM
ncbi:ATP-binding protein [Methanosarcina sp. 2.H.T.1A.6]|nr:MULTISPECIES: P-loop NTPase [unclassified Methanosarcina]KKG14668.1 ATP-binding protein [Methanosarcina sp. 2.H.T.1A.3]KKG22174.1 ATP-binding protein [Methanosarcina sp. 2.H.T.1A.8]KKG24544.1 ATP-binding protein [Methanosarcina sp. 2.H.T.1A.6]